MKIRSNKANNIPNLANNMSGLSKYSVILIVSSGSNNFIEELLDNNIRIIITYFNSFYF